jgi:D-beta-D-heptose 7-phosphate kinase/D-beta-D-heptose 1-phosphate adenosyltransferase
MTQHKIRPLAEALPWRHDVSGSVVFTNGVFDLLHPGHIALLELARAEGTALIVGVNDDGSARRLKKGAGRPFLPAEARARVVAALAAVDCVVLFSEDTPETLIETLRPDVLVKGADYQLEDIPGRNWIETQGGRVVRIPLEAGHSTTAIVERIRATA